MNKEEEIYSLIASHLEGNLSDEDEKSLLEWIDQSEENQLIYVQASSVFYAHNHQLSKEAWKEIYPQLSKPQSRNKNVILLTLGAAASVALVIGLMLINKPSEPELLVKTELITLRDTLLSGTEVEVLPHSSLLKSSRDAGDRESLILEGSARFSISDNQPISLSVGELIIEDIGTSFFVDNSRADSTVIVVYDGVVRVVSAQSNQKEALATKGQSVIYSKSNHRLEVQPSVSVKAELEIRRSFTFDNNTLQEIAQILEKEFGKSIELSESISNCRVRAVFEQENLQTILHVLAATFQLDLKEKGYYITLSGNSCE